MHPEIEKFWSGESIWFSTMENPVNPYINQPGYDPRLNVLYCRNVRESKYCSRYTVVAKSAPYEKGTINPDVSASIYLFEYKKYTEEEMLKIVRLKAFL
jgi:hypothetical protein